MLHDVLGKRVLLLQGPNGPFFMRFAEDLRERGCTVTKVNFNSGDDLFYWGGDLVRFREPMDRWPAFCRELMRDRRIEVVFVYGDQRPIHRVARRVAGEVGITVYVLEEGYLRPDHVTLEEGGANANSSLPKDPDFYRRAAARLGPLAPPRALGNTFRLHGWITAAHATAFTWFAYRYPNYEHHRDINAYKQAFFWTRAGFRKLVYARRERGMLEKLTRQGAPPFFLVPLQVWCDAQLQHSDYATMSDLVEDVTETFARHGRPTDRLVFKHHPHDRGYTNYGGLISDLQRRLGLGDRLVYVHDLHLPTLLKRARGVVTMNSTVGLSALYHGAPVKVLGKAVYDMPELTSQKSLAAFLEDPGSVDAELVESFMRYLRETNQVNGSFYVRHPGFTRSGLDPAAFGDPALSTEHDDDAPSSQLKAPR
jgi:capsule polysaccharide modification protein KpsS